MPSATSVQTHAEGPRMEEARGRVGGKEGMWSWSWCWCWSKACYTNRLPKDSLHGCCLDFVPHYRGPMLPLLAVLQLSAVQLHANNQISDPPVHVHYAYIPLGSFGPIQCRIWVPGSPPVSHLVQHRGPWAPVLPQRGPWAPSHSAHCTLHYLRTNLKCLPNSICWQCTCGGKKEGGVDGGGGGGGGGGGVPASVPHTVSLCFVPWGSHADLARKSSVFPPPQ